jgi:hypothetical protein
MLPLPHSPAVDRTPRASSTSAVIIPVKPRIIAAGATPSAAIDTRRIPIGARSAALTATALPERVDSDLRISSPVSVANDGPVERAVCDAGTTGEASAVVMTNPFRVGAAVRQRW